MRVGWIAAIAAILSFALAGGVAWKAAQPARALPFTTFQLGSAKLTILNGYLRPSSRGGARDRIQVAAFYPDFAPAGADDDIRRDTDLDARFAKTLFLTLSPASGDLDPAQRVGKLYLRFLDETNWSHPGGLIARAFADDSPFRGDELYFTAPEGREFAARCRKPDPTANTPNTCLAEMRMGDVDVEIRFAAALLSEWRALSDGARGLIASARR